MGNDGLICVHKVNFTWNEYQAEQQAIFQGFFLINDLEISSSVCGISIATSTVSTAGSSMNLSKEKSGQTQRSRDFKLLVNWKIFLRLSQTLIVDW